MIKESKIECSIFQKQEAVIKDLTDKINRAQGVQEKAKFASELQKEVDVLLSCSDYDEKSSDCKSCHFIANLRKKTADLIIRTSRFA